MNLQKELEKLSKQELVKLILELIESDDDIARNLEYKFVTPSDEVKASKQLIRKYINENKRQGFISWRNVHNALQGAEMVLEKARNKLVNGEEELSVRLGITVLSIVIDMLQYTDDSGGEIGFITNRTIELLRDASSLVLYSTKHRVQDKMFQLILDEAMHKRYDGWNHVRMDLLEVCTIYSARSMARIQLEETLDKLLQQFSSASSVSSEYDQMSIRQLQLRILERNGEMERASQLINDHLHFHEFREMAIEREISDENYHAALQLCLDGEENDEKYPGLVKKWKEYRLQIYEAINDLEKQKEILLEFVYDNQYEAYHKLKDLFTETEWNSVLNTIFEHLENNSDYLPHVYEYIAKDENRSDKILKYVENYPSTIPELYPYLIEDYPDQVEEIFISHIQFEAEHATNRKMYRAIGKKLTIFQDACGEGSFRKLLQQLKQQYNRKPAFINELEKVEK